MYNQKPPMGRRSLIGGRMTIVAYGWIVTILSRLQVDDQKGDEAPKFLSPQLVHNPKWTIDKATKPTIVEQRRSK